MLLRVPQLLNSDELARARALLKAGPWVDGRSTAGPQAASVKRNQQLPVACDEARALQVIVLGALERNTLLFSAALPKRVLPPMFNRYGGHRNHYGNHVDQAIRQNGEHRLRTDLSCTLFLSDPTEYDGGELVLVENGAERLVKLPAGHLVLYTTQRVHRVEPVTRGTRLAAFFWIESLVRSTEQRQILFDMDMALMQLRERDGDSAETVVLVGMYHNLLRLWADT